jgi:LuxR family transcriptional regulator, quorum-sensing system regulator CciR
MKMTEERLAPLHVYAKACRESTSFRDLRTAAFEFYDHTPVKMMSYIHYPPVGVEDFNTNLNVSAVGFPDEWKRVYYEQRLYECDPLARLASTRIYPFFWREALQMPDLTEREQGFLNHAREIRLGVGITVPVFGPFGRNGYCAFGFGKDGYRPDSVMISTLHMACQMGHLAYIDVLLSRLPVEPALSRRETEILKLVAKGRTNAEIAETLSLSANTVHTYVRRCYEKLEVSDRVSAALRGLALGLLG